jgi:siderophore synthetase component
VKAQLSVPDVSAGDLTALALLNCLIREVAGPQGEVRVDDRHAVIGLPGTGCTLRAELRRASIGEPRLTGRVQRRIERPDGAPGWVTLTWDQVAQTVNAELAVRTGATNPRLSAEIANSHAFITEVLRRRPPSHLDPSRYSAHSRYLASEQSLIAGHRFHPAPKARSGSLPEALPYAPEVHSEFRLRYLAVPQELIWQREAHPGAAKVFDQVGAETPAGHLLLPVHPWQHAILMRGSILPAALASGRLVDLGELGSPVSPTSSVRTVLEAGGSGFLKLGVDVRITNCRRLNPRHELQSAVAVSRLLEPVGSELAELFPGTVVLGEPACRTAEIGPADPSGDLADGLGVIAREGLTQRLLDDVQPVLAAALVEERPDPAVGAVLDRVAAGRDELIAWWDGYLDRLLPPVLHAFLAHGVVFEAHLQNVVIGLSGEPSRMPTQLVLRDLEGVKLVGRRHRDAVAALPPQAREHVSYSPQRGWDRVAYCLFVNHICGVLGALADRDPDAERLLWSRVRSAVQSFRRDHGDAAQLRAVLAGVPLPAKTNLLTRWHGHDDRDGGYIPVSLPLGPSGEAVE